jgi:hypothetical protein
MIQYWFMAVSKFVMVDDLESQAGDGASWIREASGFQARC